MQQQTQQVTVTLGDIASVVQLIDVVSRRGAIQGNELSGVGMLRDKLETFLRQNNVRTEEDAAGEADVDTTVQGELASKVVS